MAAHGDVAPVDRLYEWCRVARGLLVGEHAVGRVIARPFVGQPGSFERTEHRRDFSVEPHGPTLLDRATEAGLRVNGIGKIDDIFGGRGITDCVHTRDNAHGIKLLLERLREEFDGLIFANLVETDSLWGHRNDPAGYAQALGRFDAALPSILAAARRDLVIITSDHGVDPTTESTDHTREYVPLLAVSPNGERGSVGPCSPPKTRPPRPTMINTAPTAACLIVSPTDRHRQAEAPLGHLAGSQELAAL